MCSLLQEDLPLEFIPGQLFWAVFQCRGGLLVWITVRHGLNVLAVGARGVVWTFFLSSINSLLSLSLSLGDGPIKTEILSESVVKPKTTNQTYTRSHLLNFCRPWHTKLVKQDTKGLNVQSHTLISVLRFWLYCFKIFFTRK